jgi:hypothetical protein
MKYNSEMKTGLTGGMITEDTVFCQHGTDKHISRYSKYVSHDGGYVEKQRQNSKIKREPSLQLKNK